MATSRRNPAHGLPESGPNWGLARATRPRVRTRPLGPSPRRASASWANPRASLRTRRPSLNSGAPPATAAAANAAPAKVGCMSKPMAPWLSACGAPFVRGRSDELLGRCREVRPDVRSGLGRGGRFRRLRFDPASAALSALVEPPLAVSVGEYQDHREQVDHPPAGL